MPPMNNRHVINDRTWKLVEPLLPVSTGKRGGPYREHRPVVEGIVWKYRTGAPWRDLPERFGPWQTVWKRHAKWSKDGTWQRVWQALQAQADAAGDLEWLVSVDSSLVRVHQHAATLPREDVRGGSMEAHVPGGRAA
jgi:transposase